MHTVRSSRPGSAQDRLKGRVLPGEDGTLRSDGNLTASALRGMLWMSWGKGGRALLQIGVVAILARLIAPVDFGLVSAAFVVISFASIFAHIGLGKGLVQHPSLRTEHIVVALHTSVLLGLVLAGAACLFAVEIAAFFRIPGLAPVMRVMAISFPLRGIAVVPESLLQRELRFQWLANRELVSYAVGYGCVGVVLAFAHWGAWALVSAHLAQSAVNTVLLLIARPAPLKLKWEWQALRELLWFGGGYTLGRIANQCASEGDKLVVGRSLGPAALGVYGRAFQLMAVPADVLGDILDNVLFPTMARAQEDSKRLGSAYRRGVSLMALVMLPTGIAFYLLAPQIVQVTLGSKWSAAVVPFQILALGLLFRTSCRMSDALARARGLVYGRAWRQALYAAGIIGGAWLGQSWGVSGSAVGVLIALCINFFLMAQLSLKIVDIGWRSFLAAHLPALLLAGMTGGMVLASLALGSKLSFPPAALLASATIATLVAVTVLAYKYPRFFLGADALWMIDTLRLHFPWLRRVRLPIALTPEIHLQRR